MSYLALARKWRPKNFPDVIGQEHIVRALSNALETDRVHHAYLFAGTRGVGKTTVARILAKALNCETNTTGEPCGECSACIGIDEGRFVDMLEVDAASKTGVDDMRDLIDNVQYTPSSGRYKVYIIDEVHMLSKSSFNALLKTLEEPPPHVKFLLATTDPQKLPITVLSRCLQFNLKRLSTAQIVGRMTHIGGAEGIDADASAYLRIARAANGSMRDALSLLDQALAFGSGALRDEEVADMLGSLDQKHITELLQHLGDNDAAGLMQQVRELQELVPDYESVLDDLATMLQQIAVLQLAGEAALDEDADADLLRQFADGLSDELVQLYYQIAVHGRRDLGLAPDPRIGFEMTLLRMLAFQPAGSVEAGAAGGAAPVARVPAAKKKPAAKAAAAKKTAPAAIDSGGADWSQMIAALDLGGAARQLAESCSLAERNENRVLLRVSGANAYLLTDQQQKQLAEAIKSRLGGTLSVDFELVEDQLDTISERKADESDQKMLAAQESIQNDPNVQQLVDVFGATVEADSIEPVNGQGKA